MNHELTLLHLSLIDGIGPVTLQKMMRRFDNRSFADLYHFGRQDFRHTFGFSEKMAHTLVTSLADKTVLEDEYRLIEKHGINVAVFGSQQYPTLLAEIYAPPIVLYWLGEPVFNTPQTIAVIGSRRAHRYGEQIIEQLVPPLVNNGWVIVSGGAIGADSMAHRMTIQQPGGKTVVVLGSGLLRLYPASNRGLFDSIVQRGGALVSSFPLLTQARPGNFPVRNRIISGLSRGLVVVQAAKKSGARITADCALEQSREVFAVPGPVDDPLSAGCHALIQDGAKLVGCVDDILVEFEGLFGPRIIAQQAQPATSTKSGIAGQFSPFDTAVNHVHQENGSEDPGVEGNIIRACVAPCTVDELALKCDLSAESLHALLFDLQLNGKIKQNFAGLWEKS